MTAVNSLWEVTELQIISKTFEIIFPIPFEAVTRHASKLCWMEYLSISSKYFEKYGQQIRLFPHLF